MPAALDGADAIIIMAAAEAITAMVFFMVILSERFVGVVRV